MKLLSIIVPTYNMEAYLVRCLDSVTNKILPNTLEVIVVNDGSKDKSLNIARSYQTFRPDIISIIDKPNGNYGSCINEGLKEAQGKYIKILDADDWYNTDSLKVFLEKLVDVDSDLIITDFTEVYNKHKKYIGYSFPQNEELDDSIMKRFDFARLKMHAITYKTELLRKNNYIQTVGISHTDEEWMFYPMRFVNTIRFYKLNLYQYLLGREGQTMDPKLLIRRYECFVYILIRMVNEYSQWEIGQLTECQDKYLMNRILILARSAYKIELLGVDNQLNNDVLNKLDSVIYSNRKLYVALENMPIHEMLPYKFIKYYHKTHEVPNRIIRQLYQFMESVHSFIKTRF